jgi:hypothetical protein
MPPGAATIVRIVRIVRIVLTGLSTSDTTWASRALARFGETDPGRQLDQQIEATTISPSTDTASGWGRRRFGCGWWRHRPCASTNPRRNRRNHDRR